MAKMTKAQEKAQREEERRAAAVAQYKAKHLRLARMTKLPGGTAGSEMLWMDARAAQQAGDEMRADLLGLLVNAAMRWEWEREDYRKALENARERAAHALGCLAKGYRPSEAGIRETDVEAKRVARELRAEHLLAVASAAGYRVPELEGAATEAALDARAALHVVHLPATSMGGGESWIVRRTIFTPGIGKEGVTVEMAEVAAAAALLGRSGDGETPWTAGHAGTPYAAFTTEAAAWQAVAALAGEWLY